MIMMFKKFLFSFVTLFCCVCLFAQQNKNVGIAPFKITMTNGKPYTYKDLKKNTPTAIIYFSPTCDHCKVFTTELLKHDKELRNKQIVMVGYESIPEMKKFDSTFHISSKPYIKMGTEGYTFIVQKWYGVQRFPFVAMYNKEMKLVKTIPFVTQPEEASDEISALK